MAKLVIGLYSRPGNTVVSVGEDPALAGAAGAAGIWYREIIDTRTLTDARHLAGIVDLVLLRWPPAQTSDAGPPAGNGLAQILSGCRVMLSRDGFVVLALAPSPSTDTYVDYARQLIPAARRAGLGWLQHIVAITAPLDDNRITAPAAPLDRAGIRAVQSVRVHADFLIFVIKAFPASSRRLTGSQDEPKGPFGGSSVSVPGSSS